MRNFLKHRTKSSRILLLVYLQNQLENFCLETSYFQNLDGKVVSDNRKFWKSVSALFLTKVKSREKIAPIQKSEKQLIKAECLTLIQISLVNVR